MIEEIRQELQITTSRLMYKVQISRGHKEYTTRFTSENEAQARLFYQAINIREPFRKRLLIIGALGQQKTLERFPFTLPRNNRR